MENQWYIWLSLGCEYWVKKKNNNKMILYSNKDPENLSDFCNAI